MECHSSYTPKLFNIWLLSDALNFSISMNLKFKGEIDYATFDNVMEEDGNVVYESSCLASNIKKEIIQVLEKKMKKGRPMICFKNFWTLDLKLFVLCPH